MIRTEADRKRLQERFAKRLREIEAQRVDRLTRWRYRKVAER